MKLTYTHTKYVAYFGLFTQAIVLNLLPLLFVSLQKEFSLGLDQISFLISMNFVIQIVTDLVAAQYLDKVGYRKILQIALGLIVVGMSGISVLPFWMNPFGGLCICYGISAVGAGLLEVTVSPIVEALPGKEKVSAMSVLHSFYCWGHVSVVLGTTAYFLLFGRESWRLLPALWMVIPFLNLILCSFVPMRQLGEDQPSLKMGQLFRSKLFWLFLLLMLCAGASEQAMSQWASYFAEQGLQVSKTLGDLLGPCAFAVLMGVSRALFGRHGDGINVRKWLFLAGVLCIGSYLLAVFAPHPVLSLVGCGLTGFGVGIMWPGTLSLASGRMPAGGSMMFALLALAGDVGCAAGPALNGLVTQSTGSMHKGLLAAAVFPLILVAGLWLLKKNKKA